MSNIVEYLRSADGVQALVLPSALHGRHQLDGQSGKFKVVRCKCTAAISDFIENAIENDWKSNGGGVALQKGFSRG